MRRGGSTLFILVTLSVAALPFATASIPDLGMLPPHLVGGSDEAAALPAPVVLAAAPALTEAGTTVDVVVEPVAPVTPGAPATTRALVQYCYESAGTASVQDATTIHVRAHLQHWYDAVGASVSPTEFTIDPVAPSAPSAWTCAPPYAVNLTVEPWYPFRDEVAVVVTATADANAPFTASEDADVLSVVYARTSGDDAPAEAVSGAARVPDVVGSAASGLGAVGVAAFGLLILAAAGGVFLTRRE